MCFLCKDPLQGDFPEVIEEYLEHGVMKCIAFIRRGTLLAGILFFFLTNFTTYYLFFVPNLFDCLLFSLQILNFDNGCYWSCDFGYLEKSYVVYVSGFIHILLQVELKNVF